MIKWALDEDKMNSSKFQSCILFHNIIDKLKDIKGISYGLVTETFTKDCNKHL